MPKVIFFPPLIIFICSSILSECQQRYFAFERSYVFDKDNLPKADLDVLKAVDVWESYVHNGNDTCLVEKDFADSMLKKAINRQLFSPSFPTASVNFNVITYEKIKNGYILETLIKYTDPQSKEDMILSYFKVGCRLENGRFKLFILIDDYLAKLNHVPTKWIDYYFLENDKKPLAENSKKANNFCDSVANLFHLVRKEKVSYILIQRNRTYELFGHYYHWNAIDAQTIQARGKCFILDNSKGGYYPHELVHYLFKDYHPIGILEEGLATWIGGVSSFSYKSAVDSLKKTSYTDSAILLKMINQRPPYYQGLYKYSIGAAIVNFAYKTKGEQFLKEPLRDNSTEDIFAILRTHFHLSNVDGTKFLIELIRKS
jgi:hypothetical protein